MRWSGSASRALTLILAVVLAAGGGFLGYIVYSTARDAVVLAQFELPDAPSVPSLPRQEGAPDGQAETTGQEPRSALAAAIASPHQDRINILVLGLDVADGSLEPARTDTVIVVSVDPSGGPLGMLSIPRDLWVPIGPYGESRINTAYFLGETKDYPGGGPGLLRATVEQDLGIPIDYYVCVDFEGFQTLVDQLGGVDIQVEQDIYDSAFPDGDGGVKTIEISSGLQHLDGETALQYARSRHASSDFDRATRQQRLILAMRDQFMANETIPGLIPKLPSLYRTFAGAVQTDLSLDDLVRLARIANGLDLDNVQTAVIDHTMTTRYFTDQGWDVLLPIPEKIEPVVDRLFRAPLAKEAMAMQYELEASPQVAEEDAAILVVNGSDKPGLAEAAADYLRAQGFRVAGTADLDRSDYSTSVVILYQEKPATLAAVTSALRLTSQNIRTATGSTSPEAVDIKVILGSDFALPAQ